MRIWALGQDLSGSGDDFAEKSGKLTRDIGKFQPMRLGDRFASDLAALNIDPADELASAAASGGHSVFGNQQCPRMSHVVERLGGGAGIRARHVRYAVMQHALFDIGRVFMGRRA